MHSIEVMSGTAADDVRGTLCSGGGASGSAAGIGSELELPYAQPMAFGGGSGGLDRFGSGGGSGRYDPLDPAAERLKAAAGRQEGLPV